MNYTMQGIRGEVLLCFTPDTLLCDVERGSTLARALGGRLARYYAGYTLYPANARKWEALFRAGFTAYRRQLGGVDLVWRYGRSDAECLPLALAVKAAREEAVCPR